ncbi:hypothetical protein J4460_04900, partial [Candidatus Woesearchaeota archaeon]|nr:hypothetical protein [Candidatus Woesearchaeota archaeon]
IIRNLACSGTDTNSLRVSATLQPAGFLATLALNAIIIEPVALLASYSFVRKISPTFPENDVHCFTLGMSTPGSDYTPGGWMSNREKREKITENYQEMIRGVRDVVRRYKNNILSGNSQPQLLASEAAISLVDRLEGDIERGISVFHTVD